MPMASFVDSSGRPWSVEITVATVKAVRSALGIDLLGVFGGTLLADLVADPTKVIDVLFVVCEDQARALGIDDLAFGRLFSGPVLEGAVAAFMEALIGFFPSATDRRNLGEVLRRATAVAERAGALAAARLEDGVVEAEVEKALHLPPGSCGGRSTASPGSADSTPGP